VNALPLRVIADESNYDEAAYLRGNADVAREVAAGRCASGRAHFDAFGRIEQRDLRMPIPASWKQAKLARVRPLLRAEIECVESTECLNCLSAELAEEFGIIATENVSSHGYDHEALGLIERHRDGLVLDCGAGLRDTYYRNVVNCEVVAYDTTDVLAVAERLPFADESFDAVLSLNVLEHVKDPFQAARELMRVLKPGGQLMCVAPFLQPLHGYPHHYYNMTRQGIDNLFTGLLERRIEVYGAMKPIWALNWFLMRYHAGLPLESRERFATMTVAELMAAPELLELDDINLGLSVEACTELASAHALFGRKPDRD
jgi:SAM-dependent methyltransferase